ncbi:tetratricopeptide repeat protein [Carboxylicivirga caseinilyticus]|uniref:tetratricopeptide repeat protein n=1 Tax=Carboxylicivirga caseinilyticus TaxID=3417572 RepID=UPI003D3598AC|nr:tetratricopeptide repeat protein [Marinilabiliaceae bacterium A049]
MRYLATLSFLMLMFVGVTAQDKSAAELKNEGNEALKAKDYKTALGLYEQAIASWEEEMDAAMVYNAATCAYKTKANDKAIKYYLQAKGLDYKADACNYYCYKIYDAQGNEAEMKKLSDESIEKFPTSKYTTAIKKDLVKPLVSKANELYASAQAKLNARTSDNADQWATLKSESVALCDEAIAKCDEVLSIYKGEKNAPTIKARCEELKKAE